MVSNEMTRIHERLDEIKSTLDTTRDSLRDNLSATRDSLKADVAELKTTVTAHVASCTPCRAIVMGNGREAADTRLTKLEERDKTRIRLFSTMIAVLGILAGLFGAFGSLAIRWAIGM